MGFRGPSSCYCSICVDVKLNFTKVKEKKPKREKSPMRLDFSSGGTHHESFSKVHKIFTDFVNVAKNNRNEVISRF